MKSLIPLIEPKSILALTATAGPMVVQDICNTLCIPFNGRGLDGKGQLLPSPEKPINETRTFDDSSSEGVKVLNCDRDNIDVFSLVLQSNDERRYLVSALDSPVYPLVLCLMIHLFKYITAAQDFER